MPKYSKNSSLTNKTFIDFEVYIPTGFANNATIDCKTKTINKEGYYLTIISIEHCGVSSGGMKNGGFWSVMPVINGKEIRTSQRVRPTMIYGGISIPMPAMWDGSTYNTCLLWMAKDETLSFRFKNQTGIPTDGTYGSAARINMMLING